MPKVAHLMHLHRNTVAYRLERAGELFGIDLSDDAVLNRLRASLKLLEVAHHD